MASTAPLVRLGDPAFRFFDEFLRGLEHEAQALQVVGLATADDCHT